MATFRQPNITLVSSSSQEMPFLELGSGVYAVPCPHCEQDLFSLTASISEQISTLALTKPSNLSVHRASICNPGVLNTTILEFRDDLGQACDQIAFSLPAGMLTGRTKHCAALVNLVEPVYTALPL